MEIYWSNCVRTLVLTLYCVCIHASTLSVSGYVIVIFQTSAPSGRSALKATTLKSL